MEKIMILEAEIKELENVRYSCRDFEKIEALKKEVRELEDEMLRDLEW